MDNQNTLDGLFNEQVRRHSKAVAVICADQSLNYNELNQRANQIAHYLKSMGADVDSPVAICMERSIDLLIVIMGILKSGSAYLPLDPEHPDERLRYTLRDNQHPIIITSQAFKNRFLDYTDKVIVLEAAESEILKQSTQNLNSCSTPNSLAYIIYTSGSTGHPKGTLIEHRSVINYSQWFSQYSSCEPMQRIDFSSNYIFDMSITSSITALLNGLTIVICNDELKKDIRQYLRYLQDQQINLIKITPSYFKVLLHELNNKAIPLPHLKTIILGGENLQTIDCKAWLERYPHHTLHNEYGPTVATVAVSAFKVSADTIESLSTSVPIGTPGPHMRCYILNEQLKPCGIDEIGELYIGGLCLARGYLNQPVLTEQKFIKNPITQDKDKTLYKTGDLCKQLREGCIEYIDRIDHQLKIRGYRIEPGEIENTLISYPGIKEAIVLAQKDNHSEKLIAYYMLHDDQQTPDISHLQQHLAQSLPQYMIPSAFVRIDALPLTTNGKLDRQALPIPRFTTTQHYTPPSSTLEKTLADIWSNELGLDLVGIDDHFFELGGHS